MSVFVKASRRAKAYVRSTGNVTRSLRKSLYKKGKSRTGRMETLFSKINREVARPGTSTSRLATLKSRRGKLIRMDIAQYKRG